MRSLYNLSFGLGTWAVRVADDERQVLLDVSRKLEYVTGGSFAKLHYELSIGG